MSEEISRFEDNIFWLVETKKNNPKIIIDENHKLILCLKDSSNNNMPTITVNIAGENATITKYSGDVVDIDENITITRSSKSTSIEYPSKKTLFFLKISESIIINFLPNI